MIISELRDLIEEKTGILLLIAGCLLLIRTAVNLSPYYIGFSIQTILPGWVEFVISAGAYVGLGIPFIALLGLRHRLTSETPRLAVAGGALMALTPVLFLSGLLTVLVRPLPDLLYLLLLSPLPYVVGAGSFGLAFLWKNGSVRFVGIPLLVFSGTWALTYAVGLKNGGLPSRFLFIELLAVSLVAMGYLLYVSSNPPNSGAPAGG